jgi:hypothetical protein
MEVTTEVRAGGDMDTWGVEDWAHDAATDMTIAMAMEMGMAVTPTAMGTASTATLAPMEKNENGKRRRRREPIGAALGHGDWRGRMERTAQQFAWEMAVTARLHVTCPGPGNTVLYSRLATSLRSLAIILLTHLHI